MNAFAIEQADGVYQIGTAAELAEFAALVNGGNTDINAVLTSDIDFSAGLVIHKKPGDAVKKGESLVTLYTSKESALAEAERMYREAVVIGSEKPAVEPLVYARVEKDKVEKY